MFLILRIEYFESLESNAELTLRVFFGTLNVNSGLTEPSIMPTIRHLCVLSIEEDIANRGLARHAKSESEVRIWEP